MFCEADNEDGFRMYSKGGRDSLSLATLLPQFANPVLSFSYRNVCYLRPFELLPVLATFSLACLYEYTVYHQRKPDSHYTHQLVLQSYTTAPYCFLYERCVYVC